jgi:hypothetical protein
LGVKPYSRTSSGEDLSQGVVSNAHSTRIVLPEMLTKSVDLMGLGHHRIEGLRSSVRHDCVRASED